METSKRTFAERKSFLQLTDRDIEILRFVQLGSPKTSGEIEKKYWNEKSRKAHAGFQRIRKLIESGYIERGTPKLLYVTEKARGIISKASGVEEIQNAV